jgi:HlyD family secretion protein
MLYLMDWLRRHRLLALLIGSAALVLLFAAFRAGGQRVPVRTARAVREPLVNTISTNGIARPVKDFSAHATIATTVREVHVRAGDKLKPGQRLVTLDAAEARAAAATALARLRAAEADFTAVKRGGTREEIIGREADLVRARGELQEAERRLDSLRRLEKRGAASASEVQAAEERLKSARANLDALERKSTGRYSPEEIVRAQARLDEARAAYSAAQAALQNTDITSPFAGTVYALDVEKGDYVQPGTLIVAVAQLDPMEVTAFVDEPEIGRLQLGQPVTIRWDAVPDRTWEGKLTRLPSAVVQRGSRSVGEIACTIANADHRLLPNVNVNVGIITSRNENALTVPREAVHRTDGASFVFEVVDSRLHKRNVQTGLSSLTRTEITSGLDQNSVVALGAVTDRPLAEGISVKPAGQ